MHTDPSVENLKVNWVAAALAAAGIVLAAAAIVTVLVVFRPQAEEVTPQAPVPVVEYVVARSEDVAVPVPSQGTVEPKTVTQAASEVPGRVIWVADNFRRGAVVREGDELLKIDPADYEAAVAQAQSTLAEAQLEFELEQAKANQARREWDRLSQRDEPSDLVMRKPQLLRAEARRAAAEAALARAQRDLERTVLKAPYDGRLRSTSIDLGSYVAVGTPLAEMYASDVYEVRLPLSVQEFNHVKRPAAGEPLRVMLGAPGADGWDAEVVRREGEIDRRTRSVYLIAEVEVGAAAEASHDPATLLMPGRFVEASVEGAVMQGVVAVERSAFVDGERVLVLEGDDTLKFRQVSVRRVAGDTVYVDHGLVEGDRVCVTPLALPYDGMKVKAQPAGEAPAAAKPAKPALAADGAGDETAAAPEL